jgi:hypothetical protein
MLFSRVETECYFCWMHQHIEGKQKCSTRAVIWPWVILVARHFEGYGVQSIHKLGFIEGYGLQPVHKPVKIIRALAPEGTSHSI